ncbi:MAG: NADH-quinone oxidoreductase subunit H [Candidatus Methanofastidiosia archaeon]|jgi:NADH-quinone oxidoreductase subunit H
MNIDPLISVVIFPGLLFTSIMSFVYAGMYRKVRARMQNRQGPPFIQPVYDFIKLLAKDSVTPSKSGLLFTWAPIIALGTVLIVPMLFPLWGLSFAGDIIVVIYVLNMSSIMLAVGGFSSGSPFGAVGGSREITQLFAYELPLAIAIVAVAVKTGSFSLAGIAAAQEANGMLFYKLPFACIAFLSIIPAKVGLQPFDIPEAEQEILGGPLVEYSGYRLAIFELAHEVKAFVVVSLAVVLFFWKNWWLFLITGLLLWLLFIFIKIISARIKTDQSFVFFWQYMAVLALVDLVRVVI